MLHLTLQSLGTLRITTLFRLADDRFEAGLQFDLVLNNFRKQDSELLLHSDPTWA
ncbi:hypothetical protein [Pseudomonas fluorescens]